jgi:hypothetical protein
MIHYGEGEAIREHPRYVRPDQVVLDFETRFPSPVTALGRA